MFAHLLISASIVLIETLWNVKLPETVQVVQDLTRINRNIVECKEQREVRKNVQH